MIDAVALQRSYYVKAASHYEEAHDEHRLAFAFMCSVFPLLDIRSVLDVGAGTGRAILQLKQSFPYLHVVGVEPSDEMRAIGYGKGLGGADLVPGDALALPYADNAFDLVCEMAVLHHVAEPSRAVAEMLRVARRAIFISDSNNFGQGRFVVRLIKHGLRALGLWPVANLIKTRGRGYSSSEGDGVYYSYSVFSDLPQIRAACRLVHVLNVKGNGRSPFWSAPTVAILGIK